MTACEGENSIVLKPMMGVVSRYYCRDRREIDFKLLDRKIENKREKKEDTFNLNIIENYIEDPQDWVIVK